MTRFAMRILGVASAAFAASALAAVPESALVESAIASEVTTGNLSVIRGRLNASRERLNQHVAADSSQQIGGVIVFAAGRSSKEVAEFAGAHALEVTRAEAKVAVGDADIVQTMSFGADALFFLDGPLDERLEKLVGRQRGVFMAMAQAPKSPNADVFREAAYSRDIRFYKIEVVGPAKSFDAIEKGSDVAAVFVDETNARVEGLAVQRSNATRMRGGRRGTVIAGRPLADGPPPEVGGARIVEFGGPPIAPPDRPEEQPKSGQR